LCGSSRMCIVAFSSAGFSASGVQRESWSDSSRLARWWMRGAVKGSRAGQWVLPAHVEKYDFRSLYLRAGHEGEGVFCDAAGARFGLGGRVGYRCDRGLRRRNTTAAARRVPDASCLPPHLEPGRPGCDAAAVSPACFAAGEGLSARDDEVVLPGEHDGLKEDGSRERKKEPTCSASYTLRSG
jgi:hypothetical protein